MGFDDEDREEGGIFDAFLPPDDGEDGAAGAIEIETPPDGDNQDAIISNPFEDGQDDEPASPPVETDSPPPAYDTAAGEADEREPFAPSKAPAAAILEKGPRKLNKTFILYALCGIFSVFIIFTLFVSPLMGKKKAEKTKKPTTAAVTPVDYSALVPKKDREKSAVMDEQDDEILNNLPPVNPEYRYIPPEEKKAEPVVVSGGGGGSGRPDTRGDRLQSKSISGIKGVTPTQSQYLGAGGIPNQQPRPEGRGMLFW